ncbi:hypothetical protein DTO282F9_5675 [Paecilomyces variotii]|nr:hypothetical protein DTO282F9_5675 [Paecilomyces variotii]
MGRAGRRLYAGQPQRRQIPSAPFLDPERQQEKSPLPSAASRLGTTGEVNNNNNYVSIAAAHPRRTRSTQSDLSNSTVSTVHLHLQSGGPTLLSLSQSHSCPTSGTHGGVVPPATRSAPFKRIASSDLTCSCIVAVPVWYPRNFSRVPCKLGCTQLQLSFLGLLCVSFSFILFKSST